jgi:hypothetical protein
MNMAWSRDLLALACTWCVVLSSTEQIEIDPSGQSIGQSKRLAITSTCEVSSSLLEGSVEVKLRPTVADC